MSKYLLILISILLTGCAGHITLKSNPSQAKVELVSVKDQSTIPIGETPLQVMIDDIDKKQANGPYVLRISKDGFAPRELIFVSLTGLQLDYNFDLKKSTGAAATNKIIEGLFKAQNLAQKSEYVKAIGQLDEMSKEFPEVSAIYEMRGSIYMLRSEFAAATLDFQRALQLEPESTELKSLLKSAQAKGGQ